MTLFTAFIKMLGDEKYRREQLTTDSKSLFLIIVGIPIGFGIVFGILWALPLIFGEDTVLKFIDQNRWMVCDGYQLGMRVVMGVEKEICQ